MAMNIMIQGTMSNAGKSLLAAGLCRVLKQDGYRVAPFKSQNMALNSFITRDGGEMGRAQVVQAEAAGIEPDTRMNPILLKPTTDVGSQVIVNGQVRGNMQAMEYFRRKRDYIPAVLEAYNSLASEYDVIVIEGAGSPAEINLKQDDIVNMGLAKLVDAPVLLVGDIDRGGVFAQLYGTVALLEEDERRRIKGVVVNKFRGDRAILEPGLKTLEELCGIPVAGVIPYTHVDIDDEDSLSARLDQSSHQKPVDIAVIRLPRISNFTDFSPLEEHPSLGIRYVRDPHQLGNPDLIILPGTKSTMADLKWLRETGLAVLIQRKSQAGTPVLGVCGGYQMLGQRISDPQGVEFAGTMDGLGLLPVTTVFTSDKTRTRVTATAQPQPFSGAALDCYEIHMGLTHGDAAPFAVLSDGTSEGAAQGLVFGTYLHGLFDSGTLTEKLALWLLQRKGLDPSEQTVESRASYRQRQYDILADTVRRNLDLDRLYRAMEAFQWTTD